VSWSSARPLRRIVSQPNAKREADMSTPIFLQDADETVRQVKEFSDRTIELTRKNGLAWLETYERVLDRMLRLQECAAASTQTEWINALTAANADFMREMSTMYVQTVREQLK
jgi:hypothetical protein